MYFHSSKNILLYLLFFQNYRIFHLFLQSVIIDEIGIRLKPTKVLIIISKSPFRLLIVNRDLFRIAKKENQYNTHPNNKREIIFLRGLNILKTSRVDNKNRASFATCNSFKRELSFTALDFRMLVN